MKKMTTTFLLLYCITTQAQISVQLYQGSNLMDGCAVFIGPTFTDSFTIFEDARKLTNPLENIGIPRGTDTMAIEKRHTFDSIPLTMWQLLPGLHQLKIISKVKNAYLYTGKALYYIGDSLQYFFTAHCSRIDSFSIVYRCYGPLSINTTPPVQHVRTQAKQYTVYNILGQLLYNTTVKPTGFLKKINETIFIKL